MKTPEKPKKKRKNARPVDLDRFAEQGESMRVPPELFFNRDLSWLEFNQRVLAQAAQESTPVLERVRFCAIFASNLDELFMKRVGLLKRLIDEHSGATSHDGIGPMEQLQRIRERVLSLQGELDEIYHDGVLPTLRKVGIEILRVADLDDADRERLDTWFRWNVFPILTPLAVDPGHRFPFISNLSTSLGVLLGKPGTAEKHFARLKIPGVIRNLVPVADPAGAIESQSRFVFLDDIVASNLDDLFPGMEIREVLPFRVTRSVAVEIEDQEVADLLEHVEQELKMRRFADSVRLEVPKNPSGEIVEILRKGLHLDPEDVYETFTPLDYTDLFPLADLDRPDLRYEPWSPVTPKRIGEAKGDLFSEIKRGDILVHHPYESFKASVEKFIGAAARDPDVLAIKLTLYRTSPDAAFIPSLVRAVEAGKQVAVLVELRARFDEHRNVRFARQLEKAGVHVAYGVVGLKTHCKCALVVRREGDTLRSYAHVGTGNYHPNTAHLYTDLGLFTADSAITEDVVQLFNYLTGRSTQLVFDQLVVAPDKMRQEFCDLIDREIENAGKGLPARIIAKMNSLEDRAITMKLYDASRAGVDIRLFVRGFCCLKPGVEDASENIRVTSVVGRFLEHSRFFHFANGEAEPRDGVWLIGSADWMYRNLNRRVEACVPVRDERAREQLALLAEILERDRVNAWDLKPDGGYTRREATPEAEADSPESLGTFRTLLRLAQGESVVF